MKKLKTQKGITLVALIITIVVLLILAMAAIGTIRDSNIIAHAQNAAGGYNQAKANDLDALIKYENILDKYAGEKENEEMNYYADALTIRGAYNIISLDCKITYMTGSSKLEVFLASGTSFEDFSVIYVTYTDTQGNIYEYAICDSDYAWTLEQCEADMYVAYPYIPGDTWSKPSGETYTNVGGFAAEKYVAIDELPVFEGDWQIDEANTTEEGLTYLSKVLSDVVN